MYRDARVAVVVPAYNEERQIGRVLETMPGWVDAVVVVDDCSTDRTPEVLAEWRSRLGPRLVVVKHERRGGVGAGIGSGYAGARRGGVDVGAVMARGGAVGPGGRPGGRRPGAGARGKSGQRPPPVQ